MTVGDRIKAKREELGLSQIELAKKMNVSRQAISKAELHDNNITTEKVRKFADALGCTPAFLMGWTEDNPIVQKATLDAKRQKKIDQLTDQELQLVDNLIDTLIAAHNN